MSELTNLFADLPASLPNERFQKLLTTSDFRIERIVSLGHKSPDAFCYDQDDNEWLLLVAGAARLEFDDPVIEMKPGAFLNIPAHRRHRVDWTDPDQITIWLAIYYSSSETSVHNSPGEIT